MYTTQSYSITAPFNYLPTELIFIQPHNEEKNPLYWNLPNLENELRELSCVDVDIYPNSTIADFLEPNEKHPYDVLPHLQKMSKGIIVSVGTERSFFDLLLSDEEKCEGLVIRDINPRVKAYIDFNILLFRITETREEYCILAESPTTSAEESQRYEILHNKIKESQNIPPFLKEYYLKNLVGFASLYYSVSKKWTNLCCESNTFEYVNYFKDDACFKKIQSYAKQGNIVATIGNINDLSFLHNQKIAVVDVSNVPDYAMIDLYPNNLKNRGFSEAKHHRFDYKKSSPLCDIGADFSESKMGCSVKEKTDSSGYLGIHGSIPLIIWTALGWGQTQYFSYSPTNLTTQERDDLNLLLNKLRGSLMNSTNFPRFLQDYVDASCDKPSIYRAPTASYSYDALINIKKYLDKNLYEVPGFGCVLMDEFDNISKINSIPYEFLKQMIADPRLKRFIHKLIDSLPFLNPSTYIAFMDAPGWKEVFESKIKNQEFLQDVIQELQKEKLVQTFIDRFGKSRISQWPPEHQKLLQLQITPK